LAQKEVESDNLLKREDQTMKKRFTEVQIIGIIKEQESGCVVG
jgi:hypothetical protein